MTLKIDKAGRVVIPKTVRDRLGLHAGSDLNIQDTPEGILLKPASHSSAIVKKGNFLVYTGELPPGYDILKAIDDDREERIRHIWGFD